MWLFPTCRERTTYNFRMYGLSAGSKPYIFSPGFMLKGMILVILQ